jgi:hypothetical protein
VSAGNNGSAANNGGTVNNTGSYNTKDSYNSDSSTHNNSATSTGSSGGTATATSGGTATNTNNQDMSVRNKNSNNTDSGTILGVLKNSVVGSGSLSQSTTYTATNTITTGNGSAVTNAALSGNRTKQNAALSSASGQINMTYSMNGQGILQANQNTGAASVQGNSVALTSSVGAGTGAGLAGFSQSAVLAVIGAAAH